MVAQMHGGGQERGLRAGTVAVPLVVGLGAAVELALADREARVQRLGVLRDRLWAGLLELKFVQLNGDPRLRLAHNLNITVSGVDGTRLHLALKRHLAVSSGSACSQGSPSHVLTALGRSRLEATASIRFGLGRMTSRDDIDRTIDVVVETVRRLRGEA